MLQKQRYGPIGHAKGPTGPTRTDTPVAGAPSHTLGDYQGNFVETVPAVPQPSGATPPISDGGGGYNHW